MLKEHKDVRQIEGDAPRRWFYDDYFDLVIWLGQAQQMTGFQLCYDRAGTPRVLTWLGKGSVSHNLVDTGDSRPGKIKASPIPGAAVPFESSRVVELFKKESAGIPKEVVQVIVQILSEA